MPDYRKTEELFKAEGVLHLYKKPLGQLDDELFYAKVTNLATNTFYQVSGLPLEYRKNLQSKTYPVREVYQIYKIKRVNGSEWLKSRGRIVGLDRLGNEVEHSFTDPEMFYKPELVMNLGKRILRMNTTLQKEYVSKLVSTHMMTDIQSTPCHLTKRTLNLCTNRGRLNPHRLLVWLYSQKEQVRGRDRLQTQNISQKGTLTKCGKKWLLPSSS
jgi:hypothetical protein